MEVLTIRLEFCPARCLDGALVENVMTMHKQKQRENKRNMYNLIYDLCLVMRVLPGRGNCCCCFVIRIAMSDAMR